jgi:uncharacterized protein YlaI
MKKFLKRKWQNYLFLDYSLISLKNFLNVKCPSCNRTGTLQRMLVTGKLVKIRRLFGFRMYHCRECKWDGYLYRHRIAPNLKKIFLNYFKAIIALYIFYRLLTIVYKFVL